MSSNLHKNLHQDDDKMHEVKGFPTASKNYCYQKSIRGLGEWQRNYRHENALASVTGYAAPLTENDGDVYIVESPDLDVNGIVWQSGTTVRFTFTSGYSNIYAVNNYLQVSGAANIKHNGVFIITAVNASYLEVTITDVTDATDDVASGSTAIAYVTHQDYDPESLSNGQSIPRQGVVKYNEISDLWYGDAFEQGDEILNVDMGEKVEYNGNEVNHSAKLLTKEVTISSEKIIAMYSTPIALIASPGANKIIFPVHASIFLDYGTTLFTGGGVPTLEYGSSGSIAATFANIINYGADSISAANITTIDANTAFVANQGLTISNNTAAFATGDSTVKIKVVYYIADFS